MKSSLEEFRVCNQQKFTYKYSIETREQYHIREYRKLIKNNIQADAKPSQTIIKFNDAFTIS